MIRKNGTVKTNQIYKIRAFITEKDKKSGEWNQTYYQDKVVIAHIARAQEIYKEFHTKVQSEYFDNRCYYKKADVALFVPHIHENGELAYWPDNGKYIERCTYNID